MQFKIEGSGMLQRHAFRQDAGLTVHIKLGCITRFVIQPYEHVHMRM